MDRLFVLCNVDVHLDVKGKDKITLTNMITFK